jgi:transketolase
LGFSVVEPFQSEFPDRFINAGVAEQNMMGVAAGLASEGMHVFVYSIANFPTFRCAEQIRNDVAYHQMPVTVVAVGGGVAYGNLGYSHHAIQDFSLIRGMPNMLICSPGDSMETRSVLRYLVENPQPSYLRLGKSGKIFYQEVPEVTPGKWNLVSKSSDGVAILATGNGLGLVEQFKKSILIEPSIYSLPIWGMEFKKMHFRMNFLNFQEM